MKAPTAPGICVGRVESRGAGKVVVAEGLMATVPASASLGSLYLCIKDNDAIFPVQMLGNLIIDVLKHSNENPAILERLALDEAALGELLRAIGRINSNTHELLSAIAKEIAESASDRVLLVQRVAEGQIKLETPFNAKRVRVAVSPDGKSLGIVSVYNGGTEIRDAMIEIPGLANIRPFRGSESLQLTRRLGTNWYRGSFAETSASDDFANPSFFELVRGAQLG